MYRFVKTLSCILTAFLAPRLALAHVPYFERPDFSEARPFQIPLSVEQSIAAYAWLETPDDVDVYKFTIPDGEPARVYLEVLVPVCAAYQNLAPWFALVGPGLPDRSPALDVPFEVPPGKGVVVMADFTAVGDRESFYEPFGDKSYYQGPNFDEILATPGNYTVYYWAPNGETGDYVAVIGAEEIWRKSDIVRALFLTPGIRKGRELHQDCQQPAE